MSFDPLETNVKRQKYLFASQKHGNHFEPDDIQDEFMKTDMIKSNGECLKATRGRVATKNVDTSRYHKLNVYVVQR